MRGKVCVCAALTAQGSTLHTHLAVTGDTATLGATAASGSPRGGRTTPEQSPQPSVLPYMAKTKTPRASSSVWADVCTFICMWFDAKGRGVMFQDSITSLTPFLILLNLEGYVS